MKKKIFSTLLLVAFTLASTSMFVSCKDYDDDFAQRDKDIAALRAELESRLAQCKANCDAEHAKFLTQHQSLEGYAKLSDIPSLDGYAKLTDIPSLDAYATWEALRALEAELANYVKAEAIQGALDYIASLMEKGITAEGLSELMSKVQAIDESLAEYAKIEYVDNKVQTAVNNVQLQIDALNLYKNALKDEGIEPDKVVELLKKIENLNIEIKESAADKLTDEEVAELKKLLGHVDELINQEAGPDINVIQYLIDKTLSSLVLMPSAYVAGLATIEVPALYYQPLIGVASQDTENEYYHYFDAKGNPLTNVDQWRFDSGTNAPSATIPTWDEGFGWSDEYSGYDYKGEGANNGGEGTMLPIYRKVVEQYKNVLTAKFVPAAVAKYHVNPATVKLDDYTLSFFTNTATVTDEIESRNTGYNKSMAKGFAAPVNAEGKNYTVNNGILEVPFKINDWENYVEDLVYYFDGVAINQKKQSKVGVVRDSVNFIALQMTKEKGDQLKDNKNDVSITSDYAAVLPALIHINAIADNGPENKIEDCQMEKIYDGLWATKKTDYAGHMFKWAEKAIEKDYTHSIAYNKTLDILPFVETHFTYIGAQSAWSSYDQRMDAETFNRMGLHYAFSVVDYEDGNHDTGESRHITLDAKYENDPRDANDEARFKGTQDGYLSEVILTPRSVSYDKEGKSYATIKDQIANRNAIDREPLIKVEILDDNNLKARQTYEEQYKEWFENGQKGNAPAQTYKALEVGYIKLLITDNFKVEPVALQIEDIYWMNCTAEGGIKWSQVEESILEQLGENGYTKKQFEDEYELELKDAKYAQRFINAGGVWQIDPNPLGDVEYTLFTINDPKDKQTNVIKWGIGTDYETIAKAITGKNSFDEARAALMSDKDVNKRGFGLEGLRLETTVRFVKKNIDPKYKEMSAIYVTIYIPAPQVRFAYGQVKNKDLSHWYQLNAYKAGTEKDSVEVNGTNVAVPWNQKAIDVLENIPTPQEWGLTPLEGKPYSATARTNQFERPLLENFVDGLVEISMPNGTHFDKYDYKKNKNIDFIFTEPKKDVNAEFSASNHTWDVYGISLDKNGNHTKYTVHVSADKKAILDQHNDTICKIISQLVEVADGTLLTQSWIRMVDNDCANDILNYSGRYNADGDDMTKAASDDDSRPFYLQNNADKKETFTAYLQIVTNDVCNNLLLDNSYFNAKFLRPINAWGINVAKIDATNMKQEIYPCDLVELKDWRDYVIDINHHGNHYLDRTQVPWDFYNIFAVSVDYNNIYTDHAAEKSVRDNITKALKDGKVSTVFNTNKDLLKLASQIQALRPEYLTVDKNLVTYCYEDKMANHKHSHVPPYAAGDNTDVHDLSAPQTKITYTNNGGNVHDFHLFIPVTIQYGWGHKKENTLKVWTVLSIQKTEGTGDTAAKKY